MLAYSLGAGIPMLLIAYGGGYIISKLKFLKQRGELIQRISGLVLLIGVALIATGLDVILITGQVGPNGERTGGIAQFFPNFNQIEQSVLNQVQPQNQTSKLLNQNQTTQQNANQLPRLAKAPELVDPQNWINSQPLTLASLKGKVVIVDFWTYSCINCIRTIPYLNAWHQTYKDQGLVILGVHTPEFPFEKELSNVQNAVKDFKIQYPVFQDNSYKTWEAYDNHYWPAKYIIDKEGFIRSYHAGEGEYEETEKMIRELLAEGVSAQNAANSSVTQPMPEMVKVSADQVNFAQIRTAETYLGYERAEYGGNTETVKESQPQDFKIPEKIIANKFYFEGNWTTEADGRILNKLPGKLLMDYQASKINIVAEGANGKPIKAKVYVDYKPISSEQRGKDVSADGIVTFDKPTLYNLVNTGNKYERHAVTLEFLDVGAKVYVFTFG